MDVGMVGRCGHHDGSIVHFWNIYVQVDSYSREMRSLENNLKASNIELDETNMKLGTAQSQLSAMEGEKKALEKQVIIQKGLSSKRETEVKKKSLECQNKDEMINDLRNQVRLVHEGLSECGCWKWGKLASVKICTHVFTSIVIA